MKSTRVEILDGRLEALVALSGYVQMHAILREIASLAIVGEMPGRRVAVVGLVNRGKSTFVNDMIGVSASPVNMLPETAAFVGFGWVSSSSKRLAIGINSAGKWTRMPLSASRFARRMERGASSRLIAAVRRHESRTPPDFWLIDTPGVDEAEGADQSMDTRIPAWALMRVCEKVIVVLGVPGFSEHDVRLLRSAVSAVGHNKVAVLLKSLDSSVSREDLEAFHNAYLAEEGVQVIVSVGCDELAQRRVTEWVLNASSDLSAEMTDAVLERELLRLVEILASHLSAVLTQTPMKIPSRVVKQLPGPIQVVAKAQDRKVVRRTERRTAKSYRRELRLSERRAREEWKVEAKALSEAAREADRKLAQARSDLSKSRREGCLTVGLLLLVTPFLFLFGFFPGLISLGIAVLVGVAKETAYEKSKPHHEENITRRTKDAERAHRALDLHKQLRPGSQQMFPES